jgi:hypothetical protein
MSNGPSPPGTWDKRRLRADLILVFCAGASLGLTIAYPDSPLVSAYCMALVALAGTVWGCYAGFATWDDKNAREAQKQ